MNSKYNVGKKQFVKKIMPLVMLGISFGLQADTEKISLEIESQLIGPAMMELATKTQTQIVFPRNIGDTLMLPKLKGEYSLSSALDSLLAGSGLVYEFVAEDSVVIKQGNSEDNKSARDPSDLREVEEIIVSAQKRDQNIKDVPISIVAMGADELEERNINNLEELGMAVPGVAVQENNSYVRRVTLRGVGSVAHSASLVGFYLDEVPITGAAQNQQMDTRIYDLERVEVLRGPQGTLYGEGSMGGTLRFITRSPDLSDFHGKTDISALYTQKGSPGQKIQGVVNMPLIADELGLRVAGTIEHGGGWIDQPAASQQDINDFDLLNLRIKGLWQPNDTLRMEAMAIIHRNNVGAPSVFEDENGDFRQSFGLTTSGSVNDDYNLYNFTVTYDFDGFSLLSTSSYIETDKKIRAYGNQIPILAPPSPPFDALSDPLNNDSKILSQEVRLSSNGDGPWHWTTGAYYRDAEANYLQGWYFAVYEPGDPLPPGSLFAGTDISTSWAVFGDTSFELSERLEIGIGLRYFEDKRTTDPLNGSYQQDTFDATTSRIYLNYHLSDDAMIYTSAASGFRSGGFNLIGLPPFQPEELWTYELGLKMSMLDGGLDTDIALFYTDYTDMVVTGIVAPPHPLAGISLSFNAGTAIIQGIEWSTTWHATDQLSLTLNGNYVDSTYDKIGVVESSGSHLVGDRLDLVPKYAFAASANYEFDWNDKPAYARLDYNQRGRSVYRNRSLGPHFTSSSDVNNILNFRLNVNWTQTLSFGVFAQNLLNDRGYTDSYTIVGQSARSRPRTVGINIGFEFD